MAKGILLDTSQLRPQPRGELCGLSLYLKYAKFCDLSGQAASHSLQAMGHWSLLPDPPDLLPARVSGRHAHPCMVILAPDPQRIFLLLLGFTFPGSRGPHRICPLGSTHLATSGPCLNCPALPATAFLWCCLPLDYAQPSPSWLHRCLHLYQPSRHTLGRTQDLPQWDQVSRPQYHRVASAPWSPEQAWSTWNKCP